MMNVIIDSGKRREIHEMPHKGTEHWERFRRDLILYMRNMGYFRHMERKVRRG